MSPRQNDRNAHDNAQQKTDAETESSRIADRALGQIKDSGWFIFVHCAILPRTGARSKSRQYHCQEKCSPGFVWESIVPICMNYTAAVSDFFKSPKWMMNMLLAGVCGLIPFIGPIVIKGWLITGFWGRADERFETFPDFDFSNFGKYLERGLWPFLVTLVSSVGLAIVFSFVLVPLIMITSLAGAGADENTGGCIAAFMMLIMMVFYVIIIAATMFILTPLVLRASITQDFAQSFNFAFVKKFVSLVWKEILLATLFQIVAGAVLGALGMLALCVGIYLAVVVVYFCWVHLQKQLYGLYLSRGGEPIPVSPKLHELPAPPAAAI